MGSAVAPAEAQAQVFERIWEAWSRWRRDPKVAVDHLAGTLPEVPVEPQLGAWWLARMAYRTRRLDALAIARRLLPSDAPPHEGPIRVLERRWVDELTGGSARVGSRLLAIADAMDELGYRFPAACVYADAALTLAREGEDAGAALERAREVHDAIGLAPLLGRLPETRWMARPTTATVARGRA
jgi:hypothetical protein